MLDACVASGLLHTLFIADQEDLNILAERDPTLDRVPLDVANVAAKWLRHREDRQHPSEGTASFGASRTRMRFRTIVAATMEMR